MPSTTAIIVGAGSGKRYGGYKQVDHLLGYPILHHTVSRFQASPDIDQIVVVISSELLDYGRELTSVFPKIKDIIVGGDTRAESVYMGMRATDTEYLLVHDAVRPMVSLSLIHRVRSTLDQHGIVVPIILLRDTMKYIKNKHIYGVLDREGIVLVQTPQGTRRDLLKSAYEILGDRAMDAPDESTLIERAHRIHALTVEGEMENIKVTFPEDKSLVETFMQRLIRVGYGYDIHRLVQGEGIWICGVKVPASVASVGHSDADVGIHALIDALLGASALGNIGERFPDTAPEYKGVSSSDLLKETISLLHSQGISVLNIDITVILERPKIMPYVDKMRTHLSNLLGIDKSRISIKGKRGEGVGPVGKGEAIVSIANVLVITPI